MEELPAPAPMSDESPAAPTAGEGGTFSILETESRQPPPSVENRNRTANSDSMAPPATDTSLSPNLAWQPTVPQLESPLGYRVLLQGPLHEAFGFHPTQGKVVPSLAPFEPPAEVQELRPRNTSDSELVWLSGYWAWSDLQEDFLWVSGMYRRVPPGRTWKPGYWAEVSGNFAWVRGYWADKNSSSEPYLPIPPESKERGPTTATNNQNSFWLPGHWVYEDGDYHWKDGYWTQRQSQWIWQPAHYVWTPRGHLFVSGYWDFEPTQRGLLYPPVAIPPNLYTQPGFRYRPELQIATSSDLMLHLFCHPNDLFFHWGDYYGAGYGDLGFVPWFAVSPWSAVSPWGARNLGSLQPDFSSVSMISHYRWKYGESISQNLQRHSGRMNQIAASATGLSRRPPVAAFSAPSSSRNNFDAWLSNPEIPSTNNLVDTLAASLSTTSDSSGFARSSAATSGFRDVSNRNTLNRNTQDRNTLDRGAIARGRLDAANTTPQVPPVGSQLPARTPNASSSSRLGPGLSPATGNALESDSSRGRGLFSRRRSGPSDTSARSGAAAGDAGALPPTSSSGIPSRLPPGFQSPFNPPQFPPTRGAMPDFPFPGFRPPDFGGSGFGPPGGMRPPLPGRRFGRDR
ncbi:MAG: hypothetical protein NXI32_08895 [bacterium]|nr:hypothetical protein [bacterium]